MKAYVIDEFGGPEKLQLKNIELPPPGPSELVVEVKAIGVNPVDWKIQEGYLKDVLPHQFPIIPGWDAAGIVNSVGIGITAFQVGDEVWSYGRKETVQFGSYAEFMTLPERLVAAKPKRLSFNEAGATPLAALTAWQSLFEAGNLAPGQSVLIPGAAGGVGHFAVQLARQAGARVIGSASQSNHDFVRKLGADQMIDYRQEDMATAATKACSGGVDLVLDCVGGEAMQKAAEALAPQGRLVTIAGLSEIEEMQARGIDAKAVFVRPDIEQLNRLGEMMEQGALRVNIERTYPFEQAPAAQEKSREGHVRGKLVLVP